MPTLLYCGIDGSAIADLVGWALLRFLDGKDMGLAMPTLLYCGIDGSAIADLVGWALLRFLAGKDMGLVMPTLLYCGIDGRGDRRSCRVGIVTVS